MTRDSSFSATPTVSSVSSSSFGMVVGIFLVLVFHAFSSTDAFCFTTVRRCRLASTTIHDRLDTLRLSRRHRFHAKDNSNRRIGSTANDGDGDTNNDAIMNDAASALTEFMAKAHEEKIAAMKRIEDQYKSQIDDLQAKVVALEDAASKTTPTSGNSFAFPATNKDLTDKVDAYRTFIADYIVKAQEDKFNAVKAAEEKVKAKYEAIIDDMKSRS